MLQKNFKTFLKVSLLLFLFACATVLPPPMETCVVDSSDNSLVCTAHDGASITRPLNTANNYVCFPAYDLKMWAEYCHK